MTIKSDIQRLAELKPLLKEAEEIKARLKKACKPGKQYKSLQAVAEVVEYFRSQLDNNKLRKLFPEAWKKCSSKKQITRLNLTIKQ